MRANTGYNCGPVSRLRRLLLLVTLTSGCAALGIPIADASGSDGSVDMAMSAPAMDLARPIRDQSATEDLSSTGTSGQSSDLATTALDLASIPDLAIACATARDCPSYTCVSGQCASHYNDVCADALPLEFVNGTVTVQSTLGLATNGNGPADDSPTCSSDARTFGQDAIYYFDLSQTASVAISEWDPGQNGSLFPVLYVRYGSCDDPSVSAQVACGSTVNGANLTSVYLPNLTPGRYYVWADSRAFLPAAYTLTAEIL